MKKLLFAVILLTAIILAGCSEDKKYPDTLEGRVEKHIDENYNDTSIKELKINDDVGKGKGKIVLVHLSFDAENRAKTAKDMIDMYSEDLAAKLAKEKEVNEVTVFWQVPYLKKGENIAKINSVRKGDAMYEGDTIYDPDIFKE